MPRPAAGDATEGDQHGRKAGLPPERAWLRRLLVGKDMAPWHATTVVIVMSVLVAADAALRTLTDEARTSPGLVPLWLGVALLGASHLVDRGHRRPRLAVQITSNLLVLAGGVLVIAEWFSG